MLFSELICDVRARRRRIVRLVYNCDPRVKGRPDVELTLEDGTVHPFSLRAANALYAAQLRTNTTDPTTKSDQITFEELLKALS